jgi:hypothetical protein
MGEERELYRVSGGKTRKKETIGKTKAKMGGWDQNGS